MLLTVMMLTAFYANAMTINGGTITLKYGESYYVDANVGGSYNYQQGTWSRSGSVFTITSRSDKSCTIRGTDLGTGTLYYTGVAGLNTLDMYWTVKVVPSSTPDPTPGSDYKDGSRFYYTSNGVSMQYKVISAANKTCMVGTESSADDRVAVSKSLNVQSLTIPSTANGFKVVKVASCAFYGCKDIKSIIMPETIESIGSGAFQFCASLTSITVPDAVIEIDYGAFSLCDNIEEITIGKGVKQMDADQFMDDKKLKSITVWATEPPTMRDYDGAPNGVYSLATLYVPEGCVEKYKAANTWKRFKRIEKIGGGSDEPEGIAIDATNFPDANFRNYLLEQGYGKDGILTESEIKGIANIGVSNKNINSLKGIEYFTALKYLFCSSNQLTTLDVTKNTALIYLYCDNNQLTALDVSKNTALTSLYCHNNQLTTLNVSRNTALTTLDCHSNVLTALDVSNTALTSLECYLNQIKGASMDALISSLPKNQTNEIHSLRVIYYYPAYEGNVCTKEQVTAAKAKGWTTYCSYLDDSNTLRWKEYEGSEEDNSTVVATIDEINFPDANFRNYLLSQSYGRDGVLTENEIKGITKINVRSQNIGNLKGIEHFTALDSLFCSFNQLTLLDVSKNTALTFLECVENHLKTLDVSNNILLTWLNCGGNQLTTLDVSKNTALTHLTCHNNMIRGKDMDNLINSLPQNMTNDEYRISIYRTQDGTTGNVCTKNQVEAIKKKGWTPYYYNGTEWVEYEGSDDEPNNDIAIDETHFPDANFRNYLLSQSYGKDGILTEEEIKAITYINASNKNISSLQGIEYFTELKTLYCAQNKLTSLDVSKNVLLRELDCSNNIIKGTAMDNFINSLPMNTTNEEHRLAIWEIVHKDENVCTKAQAAAIKARGWTPYYIDGDNIALLGYYYGCDADPTGIKLPEMETVNVNSTTQLTATVEPAYITPELAWSSSAENIAMVTSTGKVLGVSAGAAIITVRTSNGLSAECFVIVQDTSGIENVKTDGSNASVYNLSGQKVTDTTKKGIYIINGKKVVVK